MSILTERLASQIQKEISILLLNEVKNPKIGYVTITEVRITKDLSFATVYYTVMGDANRIKITQEALESSEGYIKSEIAKKVKMRKIPKYIFKFDESLETGNRISKIIDNFDKE